MLTFTATLKLLLDSGIPIIDTLDITSGALSNVYYKYAVDSAKVNVGKGVPLAKAMSHTGVFPKIMPKMIEVGENSGSLTLILENLYQFYKSEFDALADGLTKALEPVILIIVAIVVGFLAVAIYMPMFSIGSAIA